MAQRSAPESQGQAVRLPVAWLCCRSRYDTFTPAFPAAGAGSPLSHLHAALYDPSVLCSTGNRTGAAGSVSRQWQLESLIWESPKWSGFVLSLVRHLRVGLPSESSISQKGREVAFLSICCTLCEGLLVLGQPCGIVNPHFTRKPRPRTAHWCLRSTPTKARTRVRILVYSCLHPRRPTQLVGP